MSKFSIQKSDAPFMTTYIIHYDGETLEIAASDLPALAACVSAAMAEKCVCGWAARVCGHFSPDGMNLCENCSHGEACHHPDTKE